MESILHPLVEKAQNEFIRTSMLNGIDIICLDIPLLFETDAQNRVDYTIVVSAPYRIQCERVLSRKNMSEEKFHSILKRQIPNAEKCKLADFVIKTGLGRAYAIKELKMVIINIKNAIAI